MILWKYKVPTRADVQVAYGAPVQVYVKGKGLMQVAYQLAAPGQPHAVVHVSTGGIIAHVEAGDFQGNLQCTAQAAVNRVLENRPADAFAKATAGLPTLNPIPEVVAV